MMGGDGGGDESHRRKREQVDRNKACLPFSDQQIESESDVHDVKEPKEARHVLFRSGKTPEEGRLETCPFPVTQRSLHETHEKSPQTR